MRNLLQQLAARIVYAVSPWGEHSSHYVTSYREDLDRISESLSYWGHQVGTRFDRDAKCAELHVRGKVLARVAVHGEMCGPCRVIVETELPESARSLFLPLLPGGVEFTKIY